jgi:hypothetical protein
VSEYFTADDVTAAAEPIWVDWCNHPSGCDCKALAMETARRSVAAVAPSIAARTLRQAADDLTPGPDAKPSIGWGDPERWLRARADQIEEGS